MVKSAKEEESLDAYPQAKLKVMRMKSTLHTSQSTAIAEGNSTFKGKISIDDADVLVVHIDLSKEVEVKDNSETDGALFSVQQSGRIEAKVR